MRNRWFSSVSNREIDMCAIRLSEMEKKKKVDQSRKINFKVSFAKKSIKVSFIDKLKQKFGH